MLTIYVDVMEQIEKKKNQFYNIYEHKNGGAGLGFCFLENASLHLE